MEKIIIKVPGQYRYMGEWDEFIDLFPRFPHIMDKQVPGCGFTEWCLTNPDNVILCSPRNMLILNKWEQHPDDVFRVHNDKYDIDPGVDRDLNNDAKEKSEVETFIQTLERLSKEEKESFTSQLFRDLDNYFKRMDSCKKPYKILVTYDSFRILKDILKELNNFNTFQIIVDEFQTIFTDSRFKSDTELEFVNVLAGVEKVCYVSATPMIDKYLEQLPEFCNLPYYELDWTSEDPFRLQKPNLTVRIINSIYGPAKKIIESYKAGEYVTKMVNGKDGTPKTIESKEAMIYVNSVNNIIQIIKKSGLKSEECNILCSNTKENLDKIQTKLGKSFNIGKVPLKHEARKKFTFCTRTVYLGADFYSDNARSFILSDANIECLAVDISLDLPQILGRQRNLENPWKNEAEFFYKPFIKTGKEESKAEFDKRIAEKLEFSKQTLSNYHVAVDKKNYLSILKDRIQDRHYRNDYVAINEHAGSEPIPVINQLVLVAEQRAYDIQQIDYADRFSVFNALSNSSGLSPEILEEAKELQNAYDLAENIPTKLKILCEYPVSDEARKVVINSLGDSKISEYLVLGPERLKALGYNTTKIRKEFGMACYDWGEIIKDIRKEFIVGERYSKIMIKEKLKEIYKKYNYPGTAKGTDLEKWFEIKLIQISVDGKRKDGFEILKNK